MTDPVDRAITIRLSPEQIEQAEFLQGLESWLELGLLSDVQVRQLAQQLSCPLPSSIAAAEREPVSEMRSDLVAAANTEFAADATDFAPPAVASTVTRLPDPSSTWLGRSLQAFMAEISVVWLLFLGVFLVVVSSGVLAASQWQNFPPTGQYGILFAYTLAFFAAGLWTGRQPHLHLTARMLQITTLLIIPVNFWMMDGLRLWQTGAGVGVATIAALALSAVSLFLLRPQSPVLSRSSDLAGFNRVGVLSPGLNSIGLSWLHWGWSVAAIPLMATYVGTIATAFLLVCQETRWQETRRQETRRQAVGLEAQESGAIEPIEQNTASFSAATLIIALSLLLLVGRAVWVAQIPVRQLGLALGICGWLWCWLTRPTALQPEVRRLSPWTAVGVALLLLGWAVAVADNPPWQAIGISGLALWLLLDRLRTTGESGILLAAFLVGLQAYGLLWRLFPAEVRQNLIQFAAQLFGSIALPQALIGLAVLPYLWLTLGVARWLRQGRERNREQRRQAIEVAPFPFAALTHQTETIAFILGLCLTVISLGNPGVRSLNLLLSAVTLGWLVTKHPSRSPALIYLTHTVVLSAILSGIEWRFPALSAMQWATVFLGLMAIEWGFSVGISHLHGRQSAWYLGLALAGCSYAILLPLPGTEQMLIWLIAPGMLTGLSRLQFPQQQFPQPRLAAWLSVVALCAQLLLLGSLNTWIFALSIATVLMVVNTNTLRQQIPAILAIGLALGLETALLWRTWTMTSDLFLLMLATMLWQLWLLRHRCSRSQSILKQLYAIAANGWGVVLCVFSLLLLTGLSAITFTNQTINTQQLLSVGLVIGAIGYRLWQQPTNLGFWGLAWAVETGVAIGVGRSGGSVEALGIANIGLGLVTQLAGDSWVRHQRSYRSSWHLIPLVYAAIGFLLIHMTFTAWTGLYTLLAALVAIGVGRRAARFQLLTLGGLMLASLAAYELLIYQLLQAEGGRPGDGLTLLAALSIAIAWGHRFGTRRLVSYLHLAVPTLQFIAHLHWLLGSGLAVLAVLDRLSAIGTASLIMTALALSGYALFMGNQRWNRQQSEGRRQEAGGRRASQSISQEETAPVRLSQNAWTYAGIAELLATISYGLYEAVPDTSWLLSWAGAIAAVLAVALYLPPWKTWGWSAHPWRQAAGGLPGLAIVLTAWTVVLQSLLIAAAFYAWFAKSERQIRWSYLSLVLFDWALWRWVQQQGWLNPLWISAGLGGTLLYVAQLDPGLHAASARAQRHWLRSLATSLICLTALYQAEVETGGTAIGVGFFTLGLSIGLIFAGLLLRVRAFLYVGTATFILRILRWLWLFVNAYSLLLWAVGIVLGVIFIWIAATFEARRSQVGAVVRYWSDQLEQWE